MNYNITEDDLKLLNEIKDCFTYIGFGKTFGLLGNSNAHLRDLLCNDDHCYEIDPVILDPRKCTLNKHDLNCVKALDTNIKSCLKNNKEHKLYDRLEYLINKIVQLHIHC